jgi:membrane-associated phospholipid phosphatase
MLWGRFRIVMMTLALWAVYRMIPCRFTYFCRIGAQLLLLPWWYPDTYLLNRIFPNLDHIFAAYEQQLFGCHPALTFAQSLSHPVFSELMHLGYASYFPMIAIVTLFYFFCRYKEFDRTEFIILTSFFIFYVIFIFLPVTGPQYYYLAVGMDNIANGVFPNVNDYFVTHMEALPMGGNSNGFLYQSFIDGHTAGERPTAAFPSSHVGMCTVLMLLAWRSKSRGLILFILPFFILMTLATVYIRAHYVIDVFAGWVSAVLFYVICQTYWTKAKRVY